MEKNDLDELCEYERFVQKDDGTIWDNKKGKKVENVGELLDALYHICCFHRYVISVVQETDNNSTDYLEELLEDE